MLAVGVRGEEKVYRETHAPTAPVGTTEQLIDGTQLGGMSSVVCFLESRHDLIRSQAPINGVWIMQKVTRRRGAFLHSRMTLPGK